MDTVNRFSSKVDHYVRYRWDYDPQAFTTLMDQTQLTSMARVADIGAGPGTITGHLLDRVAQVIAVEPNSEMRAMAEPLLGKHPHLDLRNTLADDTKLPDHSVDLITVGRALHWFTPESTAAEFRRILVPGGWLAILRVACADKALLEATQEFRTEVYGWDPTPSPGDVDQLPLSTYYGHDQYQILQFPHMLQETFPDFLGRQISKSRSPDPGDPTYPNFAACAQQIFDRFAPGGILTIPLVTELKLGQVYLP